MRVDAREYSHVLLDFLYDILYLQLIFFLQVSEEPF